MKKVQIGLCGLGTVGSGTFNVLNANKDIISARAGCDIAISHVGARRDNPAADTGSVKVSRDIFDVVNDPDVDVVVELIGGTDVARELVIAALQNGKHVVTANKALIAEHGTEIFSLARDKGLTVAYEAAVAGGIPIIKALREGLAANHINWLAGIINGTGNFILTEMGDKGRDYKEVLKEAQELGYAEADPTFDVEGIDAAQKLAILASLAFAIPLQIDKVFTEGISRLQTVDLKYAAELGYRVKHLGVARRNEKGIELRVHPTLIPKEQLIGNVNGVMNAIMVNGDAVGNTLYSGPGAGSEPTASSVIADIVDVARAINAEVDERVPVTGFTADFVNNENILPAEDMQTAYYLRLTADDKPGVMSEITRVFSEHAISIEALVQKLPESGQTTVPIILVTNTTTEGNMMGCISDIELLEAVQGRVVKIRMETMENPE